MNKDAILLDAIARIRSAANALRDGVMNTAAPDYPAYRQLVGEHNGLLKAMTIIEEAMAEEDDDERE